MIKSLKFSQVLLKIAQEADLNSILSLSDLAFYKFCVGVSIKHLIKNIESWDDNIEINSIYDPSYELSGFDKINIFIRLCYALTKSHFEYCLFALFFRIRNKTKNLIKRKDLKNFKYVFFSPPNNRNFRSAIAQHKDVCLHAYLPFLNFPFLAKVNEDHAGNEFVINPILPSVSVVIKIFRHLFKGAINIQYLIDKVLDKKYFCFFIKRLYFILIRQQQAKIIVNVLKNKNPEIVAILENDFSGIKLMLAEECNNQKIKNVHIQHGTYFSDDLEFIPPISRYFFCCSERERNIQIQAGFNPKNLFVYGAPIQTLNDSEQYLNSVYPQFDIVVLASRGISQIIIAGMLNDIRKIFENLTLKLRHDPAIKKEEQLYLENMISNTVISKNKKLIEDIMSGRILLTFSEDAMISCLRQKKKTIFCPNFERADKGVYGFLSNMPFIRVVTSSLALIEAINYFFEIPDEEYMVLVDDDFIDYNFGISDLSKVQNNIFRFLEEVRTNP